MPDVEKKNIRNGAPRRATVPQILNAAEWTFGTRGLKGTRLEDIARTCEIPKANILYYFGSKDELYRATLSRLLDVWLSDADDWLSGGHSPVAGLEGYVRAKMAFSRARPEGSRLFMHELLSGGGAVQAYLRDELRPHVERRVRIFRTWQDEGVMARIDPVHFLFMLWSGTQAYADMKVQFEAVLGIDSLREQDYEAGVETIMAMIRPLFPDAS